MGRRKMDSELHRIKLETGTVYQTSKGGNYYFRYQINGERRCVSLKTANQEEAVRKARELLPIVQATNPEVIATHVKVARKLAAQIRSLPVSKIWETYAGHPDRVLPATIREQLSYEATLQEFLRFLGPGITMFSQITEAHVIQFAEHLRHTQISVATHNRKIVRIRRIFETLKDYLGIENPFGSSVLLRKEREEQGTLVRRIAFTREQEEAIRRELDNPHRKLMNKAEIKVVYYIGMYTGQRLKDCALMQWRNIDLEQKRIWVKQFKTGKEVLIPIAEPLQAVLREARKWQTDSYVCPKVAARYQIVDERGKEIGDSLVNIDVLRVIKWIGLEPSVATPGRKRKATVYGFHSLRHSFASFCAEAGVPKAVVVSILGADSSIIDRFYTHVGEEAQRAAIEAISGGTSTTPEQRIKQVLEYVGSLATVSTEVSHIVSLLSGK